MRTLGCYAFAVIQVQELIEPESGFSGDVLALIARSGPVSKVVLLILALFSIASWAIVLFKIWQFRLAERQTVRFLSVFRRSSRFSEVQSVCRSLPHCPLVGVFQAGYVELNETTTTKRLRTVQG